jgi:hypothetical protein
VPAGLAEVAEWIGVPADRRGEVVRDLLRVSDRIVASRGPVRSRSKRTFPRFSSRRGKRRADAARAR